MSNFTPQQIEEFLQEFFDVVGTRQYIGSRYVPIFGRKGESSIEWDSSKPYEPLTIVLYQGNSFTSRQYVPVNVSIYDTEFWANTGNYNAQIEKYKQDVQDAIQEFTQQVIDIKDYVDDNKLPYPEINKYGAEGQVLGTNTDGSTKWQDPVTVTDSVAEQYISEWLEAHPEATTTVADNSITAKKLASELRGGITIAEAFSSGIIPDAIAVPYVITSSGTYDGNQSNRHIVIPNIGFNTFQQKSRSDASSVYAFLTDDSFAAGSAASFCDGYATRYVVSAGNDSGVITIPSDCKYIYIAYLAAAGVDNLLPQSLKLDGYDIIANSITRINDELSDLSDNISTSKDLGTIATAFSSGIIPSAISLPYTIRDNGSFDTQPLNQHLVIPVYGFSKIRFYANSTGVYAFLTDASFAPNTQAPFCASTPTRYVVVGGTDSGEVSIPSDCKYIYIAYLASNGVDNLLPSKLEIDGYDIMHSVAANISQNSADEWLSKIISMSTNKSLIHFSLDDIATVFGDLINNQSTYTSIWDCPSMLMLKNLHDSTGACITLNCFTNYNGNIMTNLPEVPTWQTELQTAATWLRFAFHAKDDTHYAGASMLQDYNNFVTGVYKLTGSYNCIDQITRLGYFEGTTQNLEELKTANPPLIGFLTADTEGRLSYDFTSDDAAFVWKHGKWFDPEKQLIFIRTFARADDNTAQQIIDQIESFIPSACDIVEVFGHGIDQNILTKFETIATWANSEGFYNYFPMDIYS